MPINRRVVGAAAVAALLAASAAAAQRRGLGLFGGGFEPPIENARYDGRFTFARLRYTVAPGGYYYCGLPSWAHGYLSCRGGNRAETSLMRIMNEVTYLNPQIEEDAVLSVDDPDLGKYPISYMTEPGFWELNGEEAAAFRSYLLKGGFVIFDDFRPEPFDHGGGGWEQLEANMQRVLPELHWVELDPTDAVFDSFFAIQSFDIIRQAYDQGRPLFRGLFEDNDRKKRLIALANFNTDVSDYWEFSATGFRPVDESNQAYKLGVNYIIYGLTH
jgi:hypothetical protein